MALTVLYVPYSLDSGLPAIPREGEHDPVRVVHLGRSTCHAIRSRGGVVNVLPASPVKLFNHSGWRLEGSR